MTVIRVTLKRCPVCGKDAAYPFEACSPMGQVVYFVMCDPSRRGCGACTDGAETIPGAADHWLTSSAADLGFQRKVAA
jgi:hypothetical protein